MINRGGKKARLFSLNPSQRHNEGREENLNGATMGYILLTISCMDCHKFVRDNRMLDLKRLESRP